MPESKPRTLGAVLYDKFELLDLYGPLEMFGALGPELRIVTVAERKGAVASTPGPETVAQHDFQDCPRLDLVLLPGGIGTLPQLANPALLDFLRKRAAEAEITMSVCSGSALLAKAGLLDGRRATSNKMFFQVARSQSDRVALGDRRALGRGRSLRDVLRCLRRHRHGARRDRQALGPRARRTDRDRDRVHLAPGRVERPLRPLPRSGDRTARLSRVVPPRDPCR